MKGANNTYWGNIREGFSSLLEGLRLSIRHFFAAGTKRDPHGIADNRYFGQQTGLVTLQYPREAIPVPDNGRYKLHNEIDDCIVCDKCAKICPVDCIEIEAVRAVEEIGKTSDGTSKRIHAARFDIDMGKCFFCGLCTTVCPTECLTMTSEYDFTEYDVDDHIFSFATMTPLEILEKKSQWEAHQKAKQGAGRPGTKPGAGAGKPVLKPAPKPGIAPAEPGKEAASEKKKPVFRPLVKPKAAGEGTEAADMAKKLMQEKQAGGGTAKPRPVFRPKIKPAAAESGGKPPEENKENPGPQKPAGPAKRPKPVIKPKGERKDGDGPVDNPGQKNAPDKPVKPRPVIRKRDPGGQK